jgi:hypothetical protein
MGLVIVASHWNEDVEWLKKSKFPVVLVDKEGSTPSCFEPSFVTPNKGGAESSYFKYIIENYENLPDNVAFIHAHETGYHRHYPMDFLKVLEGANLSHGYIPLSGGVRFYPFYNDSMGILNMPELWDNMKLPSEKKPVIGSIMVYQPGPEYIVSKERILSYPKEFYEHIYNVLINEEKKMCPYVKVKVGAHHYALEHFMHMVYGEGQHCFYDPTWFHFHYHPDTFFHVYTPEENAKFTEHLKVLIDKVENYN